MKAKKKNKYLVVNEVEIEAKNIEEAEEIPNRRETKNKAYIKGFEGETSPRRGSTILNGRYRKQFFKKQKGSRKTYFLLSY